MLINGALGKLTDFAAGTIAFTSYREGNVLGVVAEWGEEERFFVELSSADKWSLSEIRQGDSGFALTGAKFECVATGDSLHLNETPAAGDMLITNNGYFLVIKFNLRKAFLDVQAGIIHPQEPAQYAIIRGWRIVQQVEGRREPIVHLPTPA